MSTPEETVLETTLEELEARQRREQRELTQRITGMKKAVPKGDKRRKKEVQLEIAKLEAEQAQRHARELEAFKQAHATETVNEEATADEPAPAPVVRMSKQQRRKERKAAEMRRMQEEAEREAANQVDMRKVEKEAILQSIQAMGLRLHEVAANGHCLYNALSDQLQVHHGIKVTPLELRRQAADYIRQHQDDFLPFLMDEQGNMMSPDKVADYCHRLAHMAEWGGHAEILALSRVYQLPIHIVQMGAPVMKVSEDFGKQPLYISYHRHEYGLGEHYNSLRPISYSPDTSM